MLPKTQIEWNRWIKVHPGLQLGPPASILPAVRMVIQQILAPPLAVLARQTGLNQTKLKKGFKRLFNTTISSYVLYRRMEKGHELLEKGDTTVSEVAYQVGYANRAHFTRAFTRHFNYPPITLLKQATARNA